MQTVIYAATKFGYCVQVIDSGKIVHEYAAGNCWNESQTVIDPKSPGAAMLSQIRRWARQTARDIAKERGIPANWIEYDPDLEASLKEKS
jgi:hypothetical protein